jgi:hypothetical protein
MKLPAVLSEGFLRALSLEECRKLGRSGMTSKEAQAKCIAGQEKKLQRDLTASRYILRAIESIGKHLAEKAALTFAFA